jgi:hypothetical protein
MMLGSYTLSITRMARRSTPAATTAALRHSRRLMLLPDGKTVVLLFLPACSSCS